MSFPSGFLIVDKPSGVTSFSIVSRLRRLTGVRRVGHAGTLDPLASGVLPVAIGSATRLIEYLDEATKAYSATVRFGLETDTYDSDGTVVGAGDASTVTDEAVAGVLRGFEGEIEQMPPAFSAIKVAGKPLYRYAREGEPVEIRPRRVNVESIAMREFHSDREPTAVIDVVCSKGTYVRSIAHDLGQALGCGAHLTALRRVSSGGFTLGDALPVDDITVLADAGQLADAVLAPDRAVEREHAAILGEIHVNDIRAGRSVRFDPDSIAESATTREICRAYDTDGCFLAVLGATGAGVWRPVKVFPASPLRA